MTLFKQIIIMIGVIFLTLFISSIYVSTENIRDYLNEQLSSHAQDAATSLGIALTAEINKGDEASIEVYTNAMFDSGYYKEIEIRDIDEKSLFKKNRPLIIDSVPEWFIKLFPLHTPFQEATVENGWQTIGTIKVQSYPGFAYKQLWKNALNTLLIYVLIMLLIFLVTAAALKKLLKPLTAIREQAHAICQREFPVIETKPKTIEFLQLVTAQNKMSMKLKSIFSEQARITEELQKQAFQDELTGLPNRSIFIQQLNYFNDAKNKSNLGCLMVIKLNDLLHINKEYGHLKADTLLKKLAESLTQVKETCSNAFIARLSGSEFALLLKTISPDVLNTFGEYLQQELDEIAIAMNFETKGIAHIGMVTSYDHQNTSELLSKADLALHLAQQKGDNAFHLFDDQQLAVEQTPGSDEWRSIINEAIEKDQFQLYFQKIVSADHQTRFQEVMLKLNYNEQLISAGIFIPMAEYLDVSRFIDQWVIKKVIQRIQSGSKTAYCINLSQNSLQDPVFPSWLNKQIAQLETEQQKQLLIEFPEYHVIKALTEYKNLLFILKPYACQFSIDHFGIGFSSLAYLQDLKIDYLKVHGSYASNIKDNNDIISYIRQIVGTAHNLDINVIAEGIEKEEDFNILKTMQLDYYQGYYIGRPEPEEL